MIHRILLLSAFVVYFATATVAQNYTQANLIIDYESLNVTDSLTTETKNALRVLLENIPEEEELNRIEIRAYSSSRDIGESRLKPFILFFKEEGIDSDKLELITQVDDQNKVHLMVLSLLKKATPIAKEEKVETPEVEKVYCAGASKKAQIFVVESYTNVKIEGIEGTKINIKREDLVYPDGEPVIASIKVELKEFYSSADILMADLHTMDGDKVLETGGMINLKITANDEPLELKSGKSANVQIPTKRAKRKKGMDLYFGKRMPNGAVDWRVEERSEPSNPVADTETARTDADTDFNPKSYLQIKINTVVDSVTLERVAVNPRNTFTGNRKNYTTKSVYHTHEEEYFDLELPYLAYSTPAKRGGIWINVDKPFQIDIEIDIDLSPKPIDVLVQVNGVPTKGMTVNGDPISYTPRVALMLKSRAVFLRGNMIAMNSAIQKQNIKFEQVPPNEEVVLVAFLDTGKEMLFASQRVKATKKMEKPVLVLKPMSKVEFNDAMTDIAN
jgi:hypothetical protein